jgi:DmsE family decaheme c-type cytochrome
MYSRSNGFPARTLVAVLALVWGVAVVSAASGGAPPTQTNAASAARSAPAVDKPASLQTTDFVGDETCATCHESEGKSLQGSLHGKAQNPRTPAATGHSCETCHGNGKAHVEDSGNKEKIKRFNVMSARESSATCLTCHNRGNHAQWQSSMHNARDLSCTTCHSVHSPKSDHAQLKTKSVIETCASCHKQEATKLLKSGHMPVREGKMDCTSCHNPHGSTNVRMLKTGNWITEACTSCHTEKRGPYLWEHAPVTQNCATCHDPHGSNNDRMLVAKAPMLCQRCHISTRHPPTVYDGSQLTAKSNRLVGRSCVNCHSQIHGSNSPAGNRFLR